MKVAVRMLSQVNVGFSGAVGLRYEALPFVMDLLGVEDRLGAFDGLRVIEAELVRKWNS